MTGGGGTCWTVATRPAAQDKAATVNNGEFPGILDLAKESSPAPSTTRSVVEGAHPPPSLAG